jgi:hypothetical protein
VLEEHPYFPHALVFIVLEQAALGSRHAYPEVGGPPGTSLHRYATDLELGPPAAYPWLAADHRPFVVVGWR